MNNNNILIDLAADFRLRSFSEYHKWYKQKHKSKKIFKKVSTLCQKLLVKKLRNIK